MYLIMFNMDGRHEPLHYETVYFPEEYDAECRVAALELAHPTLDFYWERLS
jgi:hypothetical protein